MKKQKIIKLKNKYTGDIVLTRNLSDTDEINGITFIKCFNEYNPTRIFLVNRDAHTIIT